MMTSTRGIVRIAAATLLAFSSLTLATSAQAALEVAKASAQSTHDVEHALVQIDEMATQVQRITSSLLLVGLDIDAEINLDRAQKSLTFVDRMVQVARNGDPAMMLEVPSDAKLLAKIEVVEQLWGQFRPTLERIIQTKKLQPEDIAFMAQNDLAMVKGVLAMEEEFIRVLGQASLASILVFTAQQSEHMLFMVEEMATNMLLITYGYEIEANKQKLAEDLALFQATLTGLIHGNPEKRLIAAPNENIRAQLDKVQILWDGFLPTLKATIGGAVPHGEVLRTMVPRIETLYEEMETAVAFYDQL